MLKRFNVDKTAPSYKDSVDCFEVSDTIAQIQKSWRKDWYGQPLQENYDFSNKDDYALHRIMEDFIPNRLTNDVLYFVLASVTGFCPRTYYLYLSALIASGNGDLAFWHKNDYIIYAQTRGCMDDIKERDFGNTYPTSYEYMEKALNKFFENNAN